MTDTTNTNPPSWRLLAEGENTSTAAYLQFNNGSDEDTFGYFDKTSDNNLAHDFNPNWTVSFWFKAEQRGSGIFNLAGNLKLDIDYNDDLRVQFGNESVKVIQSDIVYGQWYHILVRIRDYFSNYSLVQTWVNNQRKQYNMYNSLSDSWSNDFMIGANGDSSNPWWNGDVALEELIAYNFWVSDNQKDELWNNGQGRDNLITTDGSTAIDINTVLFWFHFNEGSGSTFADSSNYHNDGTVVGTHYSWESGGIGEGHTSVGGVKALWFAPGMMQQINVNRQIPHELDFEWGLPFHMHVVIPEEIQDEDDIPKFAMEYLLVNLGEDVTTTKTIESTSRRSQSL
jgi:hypothetical protein